MSGAPVPRHETCAVMASGMVYSICSGVVKPVSVYNPWTGVWSTRNGPPAEINHMQCVSYNNRIYIGGSWHGKFPFEEEHTVMWAYGIPSDSWLQLKGLRGGGAFVEYQGKFYLSHGGIGGHGAHATTTGYLESTIRRQLVTNEWTALPNAPNARDHTGGGVVNGKLCVAGGRDAVQRIFGMRTSHLSTVITSQRRNGKSRKACQSREEGLWWGLLVRGCL